MKFLINAVNLKYAGGLTVALNFLQCLRDMQEFSRHEFHVLAPPGANYEGIESSSIRVEIVPERVASPIHRLYLDHLWLSRRVSALYPDVVFSMGNIALPTRRPQAVLFMFPYAIYPEERSVWRLLGPFRQLDYRLRNRVFARRLRFAQLVFPQTRTAEARLRRFYGSRVPRTSVVPAAYTSPSTEAEPAPALPSEPGCKYLLSLTRYYPHKNLEMLIPLALRLRQSGSNLRIVTTVDGSQCTGARNFIESVRKMDLTGWIVNIGTVPFRSVPALYERVHGLLLPTLLESFSSTYPDSMHFKRPIFTSDRDFARDVCGDAAFYFDPLDADSIFETLVRAFSDELCLKSKVEEGSRRMASFPDWPAVSLMYMKELERLAVSPAH